MADVIRHLMNSHLLQIWKSTWWWYYSYFCQVSWWVPICIVCIYKKPWSDLPKYNKRCVRKKIIVLLKSTGVASIQSTNFGSKETTSRILIKVKFGYTYFDFAESVYYSVYNYSMQQRASLIIANCSWKKNYNHSHHWNVTTDTNQCCNCSLLLAQANLILVMELHFLYTDSCCKIHK